MLSCLAFTPCPSQKALVQRSLARPTDPQCFSVNSPGRQSSLSFPHIPYRRTSQSADPCIYPESQLCFLSRVVGLRRNSGFKLPDFGNFGVPGKRGCWLAGVEVRRFWQSPDPCHPCLSVVRFRPLHSGDLKIYSLVNTSMLPYPLPVHPTSSQIGVGLAQSLFGMHPGTSTHPAAQDCYYLIYRETPDSSALLLPPSSRKKDILTTPSRGKQCISPQVKRLMQKPQCFELTDRLAVRSPLYSSHVSALHTRPRQGLPD
jgi:hypothetical protein